MIAALAFALALVAVGALPWIIGADRRGIIFPYGWRDFLSWPAVWLWNTAETFRIPLPGKVAPWLFGVIMGQPGEQLPQEPPKP